jgi:hypothetical protein
MQKRIEFDANSLLKLIIHYLQDHEDRVPLDAELVQAGVSPYLQRYVMLEAKSDKWDGIHFPPGWTEPYPLNVRYEGKKTMSWGNDNLAPVKWQEAVDAPDVV